MGFNLKAVEFQLEENYEFYSSKFVFGTKNHGFYWTYQALKLNIWIWQKGLGSCSWTWYSVRWLQYATGPTIPSCINTSKILLPNH